MHTCNTTRPFRVMIALILLFSGCDGQDSVSSEAPMKTENTKDIAAVNKLAKDYAAAWAKGDPELLLACYADDAVVIMSNEGPIVGKEALRELYQTVFASPKTEEEGGGDASMAEAIGINPDDYVITSGGDEGNKEVSGDLGYLWSTYFSLATPKPGVGGESIGDSGVSLLIVRRQKDGAWKVALMMATRGEDPVAASQQNESDASE